MFHYKYSAVPVLLALMLSVSVTGCGKSESNTSGTQVVAKVNGSEISIHQVNFQLSRLGALSEAQSQAASKEILARLIDQQLLTQKAMEAKLDRDPQVVQALENAKRDILSQAYIQRQLAQAPKPSAKEVDDFYNSHPELFEKRRIYRLQELSVNVDKGRADEITQAVQGMKGLESIAKWLKSKNYPFSANGNVRAAEQLQQGLLDKLKNMKDGDVVVIPTDRSVSIVELSASQEQPISREKAGAVIEQFFLNQHKMERAQQEVEKLRTAAKIEYLGNFASMKSAEGTAQQTQPATQKVEAAPDKDQAHLEKGLNGL